MIDQPQPPSIVARLASSRRFFALLGGLIMFALWQIGNLRYGSLILPSPFETGSRLVEMTLDGSLIEALGITAYRALTGFLLSLVLGVSLGIVAGAFKPVEAMFKPIVALLLDIPPIAWIVLALLWFGMGDGAPIFVVLISTFPLIFVNSLAGMGSIDPRLENMCRVFGLNRRQRLVDLHLPHLAAYIFPAATIGLASAWKVTIMSELLSASNGLGDRLAAARYAMDTTSAFALIVAMVLVLLGLELGLLDPIRRKVLQWR